MNLHRAILPVMLGLALAGTASQAQITAADPSHPNTPLPAAAVPNEIHLMVSDRAVPDAKVSETPQEPAGSNSVRFVRLSQANGSVTMDRHTGLGFEPAVANFPIVQGAALKTAEGAAEVELEDGSTLRLTPNTEVEFPQLRRGPDGNTLTTVKVLKGTIYVSTVKSKDNAFTLTSGEGRIDIKPKSHVRVEVGNPETRLSVISGTANFSEGAETHEVGKMKSLIFNTVTQAPADLLTGIEDNPFDGWDMHQQQFHDQYARGHALNGSGAVFGLSDLNYYGQFVDMDGCGRVWRPYFVSAAWDPYDNGIWSWYPGVGYTWVSPYPWGWAPFHYGSWLRCGTGWGWAPGGTWYGLSGGGYFPGRGDRHHHHHPHDPSQVHPYPPRPRPAPGKVNSMVAVNQKPLPISHANPFIGAFEFRRDSAGLGVPRGSLLRLNRLSQEAAEKGTARVAINTRVPDSTAVRGEHTPLNGSTYRPGSTDHPGYFHRPGEAGREVAAGGDRDFHHGSSGNGPDAGGYASQHPSGDGRGNPVHNGSAGYSGANSLGTARGGAGNAENSYSGSRGGGYSGGSADHGSHNGGYAGGSGGYSGGGSHPGGGYSGGGGGYSGGSHGGSGGYSGGGGGYSGGSHGGGSSSSAPSSPAPSAPAPSAPVSAPTVSAPAITGRR